MKYKLPIGILDSGIGGLIIAKEMKNQMPNEEFIYFGDTKNMPYGNQSKEFIVKNSMKIISFLYKKKCKALVIACNSITSNALDIILEEFENKILIFNVIDPIVKNKILLCYNKIGILATPSTVQSNFYLKKIKKYYRHLEIIQLSIPLLAYFIEKNFDKKIIKNYIIKNYLNSLRSIEVLILACTHYLYIKDDINKFYHGQVHLMNIQKIVVRHIKKKLNEKKLLSIQNDTKNKSIFYTSNCNILFKKKVQSLFGKEVFFKKKII